VLDFSYQHLNYRGVADLERALQTIALRLPRDVRLVVGVPRSGILAASVLALQLNLPLTDVAGYLEDRILVTGRRSLRTTAAPEGGRVLVVDDSVLTGDALREVKATLAAAGKGDQVLYAAPFVTRASREAVDFYAEAVEAPRAFAWNLLHHRQLLARACIDIDGVLSSDPLADENDDGPAYRKFLAGAQPLFIPSVPVKYVVTSRLEKYRSETEQWLSANQVEYSELVMLEGADAETRRRERLHAKHKADFYARSGTELFIESEYGQAVEIAARSGRQVFAVDRREMVYPTPARAMVTAPGPFARSVGRQPPGNIVAEQAGRAASRLARLPFVARVRTLAAKIRQSRRTTRR